MSRITRKEVGAVMYFIGGMVAYAAGVAFIEGLWDAVVILYVWTLVCVGLGALIQLEDYPHER
jgi:hypothetical protein